MTRGDYSSTQHQKICAQDALIQILLREYDRLPPDLKKQINQTSMLIPLLDMKESVEKTKNTYHQSYRTWLERFNEYGIV